MAVWQRDHSDAASAISEIIDRLNAAEALNHELLEALTELFRSYKALADSGDAGNWKLESQPEGKLAIAAIAKATAI